MKHTLLAAFVVCCLNAQSQENNLSAGATLLFQNTKTRLTNTEKENIFKQSGFLLSADKKQFIADKDAGDFPFAAFVYPTDLNKDGKEEIFILYGNGFTSGHTGSSIVGFIKNSAGVYTQHFGFPGTLPDAITTTATGYPDLVIGGPGFEFPVWKWKAGTYAFSRNIKDADLQKTKKESIESISKKYTDSIK
jgi:hypothetical protein